MDWLLGGLVESLVALLCELISKIMNIITGVFSTALGADQTAFKTIFPVMGDIQRAFMAIGIALCLMLFLLGVFRNMFSGLGFAGENPFKMACRFVMAMVLVPFLPDVMNYFYTYTEGSKGIFAAMYEGLSENIVVNNNFPVGAGNFFEIVGSATNIFTAGVSKIAVSIILLILMTVIAINFVKLLLEMFERYLLLNVIIYFSPLAASAVTLESTMKIFSSYLKMFFGQMVMLLMNLVSLKIITSGMSMAADVIGGASNIQISGIDTGLLPFIVLLLIIAMLKVLQRVDNYARDIGLTVGVTGGSLVDEIMGMRGMFSPIIGAFTGGKGGGKGAVAGAAAGAASGSLISKMYRHSALSHVVGGISDTFKGVKSAASKTGISNANALDTYKYYSNNGGFKAFANEVKQGAQENKLARSGASKAVGVGAMMGSSAMIKNQASNARRTQLAFRDFSAGLSPADTNVPVSVPISDLQNVSVGNGGALGKNDNGDLIALTTYQPANADSNFTTEYTSAEGTHYWAQNLSQANDISMAENNGKGYGIYNQAQEAMKTGSTNYDFEGKAFRNVNTNIREGSATQGTEVPKSSPDPR